MNLDRIPEDIRLRIREAVINAAEEKRPLRLLFVCLGNICRSPAAQGIFESMAKNEDLKNVEADSCGFYGGHAGDLPDSRMRHAAIQRGYSLTHRSRQIRPYDFEDFDLIFGMDDQNLSDLHDTARSSEEERRIIPMAVLATDHPQVDAVPDPYWDGAEGFYNVLNILEDACANLIALIKEYRKF